MIASRSGANRVTRRHALIDGASIAGDFATAVHGLDELATRFQERISLGALQSQPALAKLAASREYKA